MKRRRVLPAILRFIGRVLLLDLGVLVAVALVCWLAGRHTLHDYADTLILAGVGTVGIGCISLFGSSTQSMSPSYRYFKSFMPDNPHEYAQQQTPNQDESGTFLILLSVVGALSIALGLLIQSNWLRVVFG